MPEQTLRQVIAALLEREPLSARDLSRIVRISEKEIPFHLGHIARSLGGGKRLIIEPSRCRHCGFTFEQRKRFTSPSRCPRCRHEGITPPSFYIRGT